jgi:hypothetical protein
MKNKLTAFALILSMSCFVSMAGWIPSPVSLQIPTPAETQSFSATGAVTVLSAPAANTQRYSLRWAAGEIKPALTTNTLTVTVITGAETNSYAFTNGAAAAASSGWLTESSEISAALSDGVTNLPAVTLTYIASPVTVTRILAPHERWKLYGLRRSGDILSTSETNTVTVTALPAYGEASTLGSFTNGAVAVTLSSALSLWPGDTLSLTATQVTNSPTVVFPAEQYYLREPADFPE